MDIDEIIYRLKNIKKGVSADSAEAINCSIEIAEKQKPKRALEFVVPVFTSDGRHKEMNVNSCPACFQTVDHTEFCPHCGQRLVWIGAVEIVTR